MFTHNDIARYYDLSEVHYRLFWDLDQSRSLHYGYWDATTKNFHEALLNSNKVLADLAEIKQVEVVLDAGCGVGGSSLWLGMQRHCFVTGISLSEKQVVKANQFAKEAGVANRVKFEQKDFCNTGYPPESFDVVWAIESVCHAKNKSAFLQEAFRVLKENGRLVMADFFKAENLKGKDAEDVQKWAHGWAIDDFATIENFQQQLLNAGFRNIEIHNASKAIWPSAKRLYRSYFIGKPAAVIYRLLKRGNVTSLGKNNVDTAYLQYKTLKKGLWKYCLVKVVK